MLLSVFLPLLLAAVVPPPSSFCLLLPPKGSDYPSNDLPSLQYLPHNTLVSYHHQGLLGDEEETRDPYVPQPSSSSSSSSSSSCTVDDLARYLNVDDLDYLIEVLSKVESVSVKEVLMRLAVKHGLYLKEKEHPIKKPVRELQTIGIQEEEEEDSQPSLRSPLNLQELQFHSPSSSSSSSSPSTSSSSSFLHQQRRPPPPPPPPALHSSLWSEEAEEMYQPVPNEVPAVTPPPSHPPRALLVVVAGDGKETARSEVTLGPHMALLDVLNQASFSYSLQYGPYAPNPLAVKVRPIPSDRCLGLLSVGSIMATPTRPLHLSVTRTRPTEKNIWESVCLPRATELIVHRGDIIVLAPR